MLAKEYWKACVLHDWAWRDSEDDAVQSSGYANEAKLKSLAAESPTLNQIWVRFRYEKQIESLRKVSD
jgi:hypothetical protein